MSNVYVVGSINQDLVAMAPALPRPGQTVMNGIFKIFPGGKGSNQAVAAAKAGTTTYLIGATGQDDAARYMRDSLQQADVRSDYIQEVSEHTGVALITVADGKNIITVCPGANTAFDFPVVPFAAGDVLLAQFEIAQAVVMKAFQAAKAAGATVLLNTAPALELSDAMKALCDIIILNEEELADYVGDKAASDNEGVKQQAIKLRVSPAQKIIVTLGARGLVCVDGDDVIVIKGHPVKAIDSTGAGDCFCGVLAASLAQKLFLHDALVRANAAAAISVQREGAASSMPSGAEIDAFIKAA
ncbi:MAG: ribokinase [Bdellovibrionales bacterium]